MNNIGQVLTGPLGAVGLVALIAILLLREIQMVVPARVSPWLRTGSTVLLTVLAALMLLQFVVRLLR